MSMAGCSQEAGARFGAAAGANRLSLEVHVHDDDWKLGILALVNVVVTSLGEVYSHRVCGIVTVHI